MSHEKQEPKTCGECKHFKGGGRLSICMAENIKDACNKTGVSFVGWQTHETSRPLTKCIKGGWWLR